MSKWFFGRKKRNRGKSSFDKVDAKSKKPEKRDSRRLFHKKKEKHKTRGRKRGRRWGGGKNPMPIRSNRRGEIRYRGLKKRGRGRKGKVFHSCILRMKTRGGGLVRVVGTQKGKKKGIHNHPTEKGSGKWIQTLEKGRGGAPAPIT